MDLISLFFSELLSKPAVQTAVIGLVVKICVDKLKTLFVQLDEQGNKQYKVQVQLLVAVCSLLATLGDLYLQNKLRTEDPQIIMNFLTVSLPVYLNALGIHLFSNHFIAKVDVHPGD